MNLLTRNTDYAIRALIYMIQKGEEPVSTADLDRDLGLPRPFMRKTLQVLQKEGYLTSLQGNQGGFCLAQSPKTIRLIDLMAVFQGDMSLGDCLFRKKLCHRVAFCPLRKEIKKAEKMLIEHFRHVTLDDLARG